MIGILLVHAALSIDDLVISVRGQRVVDGVSLRVDRGERVALLGASGSGKSLTAAAALGSLRQEFAASGRIALFGTDVSATSAAGRAGQVSAIAQDSRSALNPLVKVGTQLSIPLRARTRLGRAAADEAVERVLTSVGIADPSRTMAGFSAELSGGQRQRVCIALALIARSQLLIADEPTTALDVVTQAQVISVLREYGVEHGDAILFITHDLPVAASLCERAVVLEHGRVVETATMTELIERPHHPYARALVQAAARESAPLTESAA